jgi:hypothetical protein
MAVEVKGASSLMAVTVKAALTNSSKVMERAVAAKLSTIGGRLSLTRSSSTGIRQQPINKYIETTNLSPSRRLDALIAMGAGRTTEISPTSVRIRVRPSASKKTSSSGRPVIRLSGRCGRKKRKTVSTSS